MVDLILDYPILFWRWAVPILGGVIVCASLMIVAARRGWLRGRRVPRLVIYAVCGAATVAALAGVGLLLGPLRPFVESVGRFATLRGTEMDPLPLVRVSDGTQVNVRDYRGRVVVLNLWGTWCPPCRTEMPDLVRLAHAYPNDVAVVTVSDEDRQTQAKFANAVALPPEAAVGRLGWESGTFRPFTIIIDRDGVVREFHFSARDYRFFEERVSKYL